MAGISLLKMGIPDTHSYHVPGMGEIDISSLILTADDYFGPTVCQVQSINQSMEVVTKYLIVKIADICSLLCVRQVQWQDANTLFFTILITLFQTSHGVRHYADDTYLIVHINS